MISEHPPAYKDHDLEEMSVADMQVVLGYLNQNEWVYNLNIGNVMQLQSIHLRDMIQDPLLSYELTRESFLEKISILCVAYFCMSTETWFVLNKELNIDRP